MKIYVAHTYGRRHGLSEEECEANTLKAIKVGRKLIKMGHNPFIPNLWHYIHKNWNDTLNEDKWLSLVSEWIANCDVLLVASMPKWDGSGVSSEIHIAQELGIYVCWDIEDIDTLIEKVRGS